MATSSKKTAASKVMAKSTTVKFGADPVKFETKGTFRYAEEVDDDGQKVIGTLYLQKPAAEALGNPDSLTVTIKAG